MNLMPVTGLTLPFVCMGGTSLLFTGISFGIILSVSRYIENTSSVEDATEKRKRGKGNRAKDEDDDDEGEVKSSKENK